MYTYVIAVGLFPNKSHKNHLQLNVANVNCPLVNVNLNNKAFYQ